MDIAIHQLISDRLDQLKDRGWVSEYLVSWNGAAGRLVPKIAVWSAGNCDEENLAGELRWLVGDLVSSSDLTIVPPVSKRHSLEAKQAENADTQGYGTS